MNLVCCYDYQPLSGIIIISLSLLKGGHSVSLIVIAEARVGWAGTTNTPLMCTPSGKTSEMKAFMIELFI